MNSNMISCPRCDGTGQATTGACLNCEGLGKIAQRQKLVLTSAPHEQTFFRGALVTQKHTSKGPKR